MVIEPRASPLFCLVSVPRVGFGTAGLGDKSFKSIKKAIEVGFRHIDTARATEWYDEESVGRVLEAVFEEVSTMSQHYDTRQWFITS